jgi:flagellar hook-basal body complex protein FliE
MSLFIPLVANAVGSIAGAAATALTQRPQSAPTARVGEASFADILETFASQKIDGVKSGEAAAISGITGDTPVHRVVDMVMTAERDLQTMIALRDKAVGAFQEITRMSI